MSGKIVWALRSAQHLQSLLGFSVSHRCHPAQVTDTVFCLDYIFVYGLARIITD